ncbi:MAG: ArsA family ATPase [Desulfobacterales bacterium]|nr:ArsA family ATPase [Desulfobacterales bacterium]
MISRRVPEYFQNRDLRLILFGGKGGVGKTTMAAAAAVQLARSYPSDKKVLVISTDPAHSLGDSFGIEIGDKVTPIDYSPKSKVQSPKSEVMRPRSKVQSPRSKVQSPSSGRDHGGTSDIGQHQTLDIGQRTSDRANLFARELDANRLLEEFREKNDPVMKKLAKRGTYFDQQDIAEFFDLSLPGMDEVMAIIEIANILKEGSYDILIVDTAPAGHTMRMLALPEQMLKWVEVMDLMQHKHRYMAAHFTGKRYVKDECDIFLDNLSSDIDRVKKLLSNEKITRFVPVTIPEPMSIYETRRLLSSLDKNHIPVKEIVVNRVGDSEGCAFCTAKKEDQREPLSEIEDVFSLYNLIKVPLFPREIRGVEELKGLADYLLGKGKPYRLPKVAQTDEEPQAYLTLDPDLEFVLFGGKGGVGKTSLASAASLHLARCNPGKKVLVFSTDPAHSLSDSFKLTIGDKVTPIDYSPTSKVQSPRTVQSPKSEVMGPKSKVQSPKSAGNHGKTLDIGPRTLDNSSDLGHWTSDLGPVNTNLFALEIDADKLFEDFKEGYKKDIEALFDRFLTSGVDIKFDREVMTELFTLAPPGLDEIMALDMIMDLKKEGKFDIFILDTSPTGHLLRFLELPDMVREWLKAFFRLLLKYRGVVRLAKAAEKALAMSRNVRRIQEAFVDVKRTAFVAVTIPEAMGFLELERLVDALESARVPCNHIAINMVIPQTDCDFCSCKRMEQQGYMKKIHSRFPARIVTKVPLFPHEVRGVADLNKMGEIVFGDKDKRS